MIDLDDQLAAYDAYLDDTARSVVMVHPAQVNGHRGASRSRLGALAAAAVLLAGTIAVATIGRQHGAPGSSVAIESDEWTLVPDPHGVFEVEPSSRPVAFPNMVVLSSIAHTTHGWVAVGAEHQGRNSIAAAWTSSDGTGWERVPHDESFGAGGYSEAEVGSIPDGPYMGAVAEHDGRVVVAGAGADDEAVLWWTDDLAIWHLIDPFPEFVEGWEFRLAAGEGGFVVVGQRGEGRLVPGDPHSVVGWHSVDGVNWTPVSIEDSDGAGINDILAYEDGFVAVGIHSPTNAAAAWTSAVGTTWERADIDTPVTDGFRFTYVGAVAERDGLLVGHGGGQPPSETSSPISWTSSDGTAWTAHPRTERVDGSDGPLVATDDEFIALGFDYPNFGTNLEWRSNDGVTWTRHEVDLPGGPVDAAYFDGTAVAVGGSSVWILRSG